MPHGDAAVREIATVSSRICASEEEGRRVGRGGMRYAPGGVMSVATARALNVVWPAVFFGRVISIRQPMFDPRRRFAYVGQVGVVDFVVVGRCRGSIVCD